MNPKLKIYLPLIFAALLITGMYLGAFLSPFTSHTGIEKTPGTHSDKIQDILFLIRRDYVDDVNQEKLTDMAIQGLLAQLDPHSVYIPAEELASVNEEITGKFEGIGVQFMMRRDSVMVIKVIPGGPADKAGLLAGDRIISAEGKPLTGKKLTSDEVMKHLKGPGGTTIRLQVARQARKGLLTFAVTRDVITTHSIEAAYLIDSKNACLKLHTFAANTYSEFMERMQMLQSQGMKNLVFDLRGNSGGLLDQAILIANEFLGKDEMIVYTQRRNGRKKISRANGEGKYQSIGLVVLIDDFSASASEILAGAVQDNDRGWIVGRRSFGKGLVQQQVTLADGSALRLTTERYYTPAGRSIQKPYSHNQEEYYNELMTRYLNGGMESPDSIPLADSLKVFTLKKKRAVYGGGGIMPDYFIPLGRKHETSLYRELRDNGIIYEFASDYADLNRSTITRAFSGIAYVQRYQPGQPVMEQLRSFAATRGVMMEKSLPIETVRQLEHLIKAFVARDLYGDDIFYQILNSQDDTVKKAMAVVGK
jgi:carboxyl-terminal processing protease